jgi:hypothetical protein
VKSSASPREKRGRKIKKKMAYTPLKKKEDLA